MDDQSNSSARDLTVEIVASYVANNSLRASDLPELIGSVYRSLNDLGRAAAGPAAEPLVKPVSIKKSIHPDYLISMEDGRQYQSLKRHLAGRGLTPADYRSKWGLPDDYPMVAQGYSDRRSALAKSLGLGRKGSASAAAEDEASPAAPEVMPEPEPTDTDVATEAAPKAKRVRKKADKAV